MVDDDAKQLRIFGDYYMRIARNQKMSGGQKTASILAVDRAYNIWKYGKKFEIPVTDIAKYWGSRLPSKIEVEVEEELSPLEIAAREERKAKSGGDHGVSEHSNEKPR